MPGWVEFAWQSWIFFLIIGRKRRPAERGPCADAVVMAVPGALVKKLLWGLDGKRPTLLKEARYLGHNIARP